METKIPFYQVLNILLVGLLFVFLTVYLCPIPIQSVLSSFKTVVPCSGTQGLIIFLAVSYEAGLIINRIGSVCIEPILKWLKLIPFSRDYRAFSVSQIKNPSLQILSREYASSRTRIALFLILDVLAFCSSQWLMGFGFILGIVLFVASCRKQSARIVSIMEANERGKE